MSTTIEPSNAQLQEHMDAKFLEVMAAIGRIGTGGQPPPPDPTHHNPGLADDPGAKPFQVPPKRDPSLPNNSSDAWWFAQPKPIQALRSMPSGTGSAREMKAWQLAAQGFSIDREIVIENVSPAVAMSGRFATNSPWVLPLGHQPPLVATFNQVDGDQFTYAGVPYHQVNPIPADAILTTLDFALPFYGPATPEDPYRDGEYGINWNLPAGTDLARLKKKV